MKGLVATHRVKQEGRAGSGFDLGLRFGAKERQDREGKRSSGPVVRRDRFEER